MTQLLKLAAKKLAGILRMVDYGKVVRDTLPGSVTKEQETKLKASIEKEVHRQELEMIQVLSMIQTGYQNFVKEMEGTAKDLLKLPVLGRIMLFVRGSQRPVWSVVTLIMDINVFSGNWVLPKDTPVEAAFYLLNLLVLFFIFGERAIINIMPLVERLFDKYLGSKEK